MNSVELSLVTVYFLALNDVRLVRYHWSFVTEEAE